AVRSAAPAPFHGDAAATPAAAAAAPQLSPAVRRLLAEHGLSAAAVRGTGERGRVTVEDVLRAAAGGAGGAGLQAPTEPPARPHPATPAEGVHRVPHSAVRRRTAEHMVQSLLHTAPHVTTVFEADMGAVLEDRARRREEFARSGAPLTLTAYFIQA